MAEDMMMEEEVMMEEETPEEEVADVEEAAVEEPETTEAVESAIILDIDNIPELAEASPGDRVTLVVDSINEDGTVGMSVFETQIGEGAEEGAMLEEGPAAGGREEVISAALQ